MRLTRPILALAACAALTAGAAAPIPAGLVEAIFPNSTVTATGDGVLVRETPKRIWRGTRYASSVLFRNTDGSGEVRATPVGTDGKWKVAYSDGRAATVVVRDDSAAWRHPETAAKDRKSRRTRDGWSTFPPQR